MEEQVASGAPGANTLALAEDAIQDMNKSLKPLAREYRQMKERVDSLVIFHDRLPGPTATSGENAPKKCVGADANASPEEELLFEHRALYEYVTHKKAELDGLISRADADPREIETLRKAANLLVQVEREAAGHLREIRELLEGMRGRLDAIEGRMITITHERSKMMQQALQHSDKMSLARDTARPTGTLVEGLAKKYGMSVEQVNEMIAAKPALTSEIEAQSDVV